MPSTPTGPMSHRQRAMAVLHYQRYDRLPVVHFGYWGETLGKWMAEGHITREQAEGWGDGNLADAAIADKLGFDFNWYSCFHAAWSLQPAFESRVIRELPDGSRHVMNGDGVVVLQSPGAGSIPAEIEHTLTDRRSWEEQYLPRLQWSEARVTQASVRCDDRFLRWDQGGLEFLRRDRRDYPYGLMCGSLIGRIRDILGVVGMSYLGMDDEPLFDEIVRVTADLCYRNVEYALKAGAKFDFAHFWEDICFKNGPLVAPAVFEEKIVPQYKRITDLVGQYGLDIVSVDCDGCVDALIPGWLAGGVNTMFPIEVGTWKSSIGPWRARHGQALRGVGGVNKNVMSRDRAAVDAEVERLKPLVELGGFIPCPDHRLAPDAQWDLVRYYCDRMRATFG